MADNRHAGSSLDDLLREEGVLEEFQAVAVKEVIAWQLQNAMTDEAQQAQAGPPDEDQPHPGGPGARSDRRQCHHRDPAKGRQRHRA